MTNNLKFKALFILAVILICIYGIVGIPKSVDDLSANWKKNIRLGLDLKGGSHLGLQMQLQDAFKTEADTVIQRLKDDLAKASIEYAELNRNDPGSIKEAGTIQINITGIPSTKTGNFRQMANDNYGGVWILTPVNQT